MNKLLSILDRRSKRQLVALCLFSVVAGFVEMIGIGLLIPFVAVASNSLPFGHAASLTRSINAWLSSVDIPERFHTLMIGMLFVLGLFLAGLFLSLYQYYALYITNHQRHTLCCRLFKNLSCTTIDWLEQHNSSELLRIMFTEVNSVILGLAAIVQLVAIFARTLIVFLLFFIVHPKLAIYLAISLGLSYWAVISLARRSLADASRESKMAGAMMYKLAAEMLAGARELRVNQAESWFTKHFEAASLRGIQPEITRGMPPHLTRVGLETVTFTIVVGLVAYFNYVDGSLANGLPILAAYAVGGVRLLPGLQQASIHWTTVRYVDHAADSVKSLLQLPPNYCEPVAETQAGTIVKESSLVLECKDVSFSYGTSTVLEAIDLSIPVRSRIAFVGETGAGKSTLLDILLSLRQPARGQVLWRGSDLASPNVRREYYSRIGYVPQHIYLLDRSILENIAFGTDLKDIDLSRVQQVCEKAALHTFICSLPDGYSTVVGERGVRLSGGQRQRLGIARALYHNPEIVIFDEATSALDNATEAAVLDALDALKNDKTLIVVAHRLNTIRDFDKIYVLENGRIAASGCMRQLSVDSAIFAKLQNEPGPPTLAASNE